MMISVLVRTHNRCILLNKCLDSLSKQTFNGDYEIVIVDSASTDDTNLVVNEYTATNPKIRYVNEPIAGAARARKKGLEVASGDILVWIDDDCVALETWLEEIAKVFARDEQADIVGGQVILDWEGKRPYWFPNDLESALGKQKLADTLIPVNVVNGANIAYKANIAKNITLDMSALGPAAGLKKRTSEDTEFCRQARILGAKIYYTPDAIVYHYVPKQHARLKYLLRRYYSFGVSDSVRYQLIFPNDKVDCSKRIGKGFLNLLGSLFTLILKLPLRLLFHPNYVLVDVVQIITKIGYLTEEIRFFMGLFNLEQASEYL